MERPGYYREEFRGFLVNLYDFGMKIVTLGFENKLRKKILHFIPSNSKSILDMATGTGSTAIEIKKRFREAEIFGVDLSENMLEIARRKSENKNLNVNFILQNIEKTNFRDSYFDAVTITFGLHELPKEHRKNVLKEAYRLLKKRGKFIIMDFNKPKRAIPHILLKAFIALVEKYADTFIEQDWQEELRKAGFSNIGRVEFFGGVMQILSGKKEHY